MTQVIADGKQVETRRRVLAAAGEVFAENGFKAATVREICRRAQANVAAVNYHFRDKEELYQAVFEDASCVAHQEFRPESFLDKSVPVKNRLRAFIGQYLRGILGPGRPAWKGKLMAREMIEPTGALDRMVETAIRPTAQLLGELVREITGMDTTKPRGWMAGASVIGQCLFYVHARPVISRLRPDLTYDDHLIEELADHITEFSWAALTALKKQPAEKKAGKK